MNDERRTADWQQALLTMALEEHFGCTPPDPAMPRHSGRAISLSRPARASRHLAAAFFMLAGIGAVLAVAWTRDDRSPAQGRDGPLLPLTPGTEWVYTVTRDGNTHEIVRRVMGSTVLPSGTGTATTIQQCLVLDGANSGFEYWSNDARGLHRHPGTRGIGLPDVGDAGATRMVALPLGTETTWPTTAAERRTTERVAPAGPGGPAAGAAGGKNRRTMLDKRGELLETAAAVTVPAGTFRAVHVRLAPAADGTDDTEVEHVWFAAGVGIVRATREQGGKAIEVAELQRWKREQAESDPEQALRTFLAKDANVTSLGPVQATTWLEPSPREVWLSGRFVVVTFVDRKVVYRVRRGVVTEFDGVRLDGELESAAHESWNALVQDEGLTGWRNSLLPHLRCTALADVALRLYALQRDLRFATADSHVEGISIGPSGAECTRELMARTADGTEQKLQLEFSLGHNDRVRKVQLLD
jgi:hypothetical protein